MRIQHTVQWKNSRRAILLAWDPGYSQELKGSSCPISPTAITVVKSGKPLINLIAPALFNLESAWNPAYPHVWKQSPTLQRATATLFRSIEIHGTLGSPGFQYCQQSKNFNSKPLKFVWTWGAFVGMAFFWLTVSLIIPKFPDFQMKNMVFVKGDSQSHITVKLYTKPCAGETTTFQLLSAQLYTLQTKEKDGYLEFIFKLAHNQKQLQNSTPM